MDRATRWLPFGLGACATVLYVLLAPASFTWLDSAELSAAGIGLGSPHPTGFPLYMMLVKAASLLPIGELGFRVNLLSAACAGFCVGLVARTVISAGRETLASVCGAVVAASALASSLLFARHAVIAEVYVPTAAVLAATFMLLDRAARDASPRWGLALALAAGLGLGLHSSYRIIAVVPIAWFLLHRLRRGARWPLFAPLVAIGVGAALHLYLPVRSEVGDPALDWGHPSSASSLLDHVTAARIRTSFSEQIMSSTAEVVGVNLSTFAESVFDGIGPATLLLAVLGLAWLGLRRRSRFLALALGVAISIDFVYSFWINPMGLSDGQNGTPLAVAVAVGAGLGATWFLGRTGRAAPFVAAFVVVLVSIGPMWATASALAPASQTEAVRLVADAAAAQAPPRAIVLTQSDSLSAALLLLTTVEGARPDIAVIARQHIADGERTRAVAGLSLEAPATFESLVRSGRPLAWEVGDDWLPVQLGVVAGVPLVQLGEPSPPDSADIKASISAARYLYASSGDDMLTRRHLASTLTNLGRVAFGRGQVGLAGQLFEAAVSAHPRHASALVNLGVVASRRGDLRQALDFTLAALEVEPNRITALINAARYTNALGDPTRARRHLLRAAAIEPENARTLNALEQLPHSQ